MPYISKAENERRRWVDLAAAIDHVKKLDRCDDQQALQGIKAAIQDGKLHYRWEDQAQPPPFRMGPIGWVPPVSDMLSDEWEVDAPKRLKDTTGRFRVLLLLKLALYSLFKQTRKPEIALQQAPELAINNAIEEVYNGAESAADKPPNIKELPMLVLRLLEKEGYVTSKSRIMELGGLPEFKRRRRKVGKTLRNEQRFRAMSSN